MTRPVLILIATVFMLVSGPVGAKDQRGTSTIFSYENLDSCGKFVNSRRSGSNAIHEAFMRGYMSAVNRLVPGKTDFFKDVDEEGVLLWVERWCLRNPTGYFFGGLTAFENTRGIR